MDVLRTISEYSFFNADYSLFPNDNKEWNPVAVLGIATIFAGTLALGARACYLGYKSWQYHDKDPHDVTSIYSPPYPDAEKEKALLNLWQEKISKLKQNPQFIGVTFVQTNQGNEFIPVYIQKKADRQESTVQFILNQLEDDVRLGLAYINPCLKENAYGEEHRPLVKGFECKFDGYPENMESVFLSNIENLYRSSYKHVGHALVRCILEHYRQCHKRMMIESVRTNGPFWYALGFRMNNAKNYPIEAQFARIIRNGKRVQEDFGVQNMHLPDAAQKLWGQEIAKHPMCHRFYQHS